MESSSHNELSKSESDANGPSTPFDQDSPNPTPLKRRKPRGRALLRRCKSTDDDTTTHLSQHHRSAPLTMARRAASSDDGSSPRMSSSDPDQHAPFDSPANEETLPQRRRKMRGRGLVLPRSKSNCGDSPPRITTARRTISGDLSEMRRALKNRVASRVPLARSLSSDHDILSMRLALDKNNATTTVEPAPLLIDVSKLNPLDEQDRAHYSQELDTKVQKLLKKTPQTARALYDFPMGRNRTVSQYILSHLVAMGASEETIRLAIRAHPKALYPNADFRSTTLHTACSLQHVPLSTVVLLHRKWRLAVRAKNKHAFLPLHNACQAPHCNPELIRFLVDAYPEALMQINKLGDTPLRTAKRNVKVICPSVLEFLEQETERVFEANQDLKERVMERQTWGSSDLTDYYSAVPVPLVVDKPSFPTNAPRMRRTAVASRSPTRREVSPAA